jgi:hypothetical protein
VGQGFDLRSNQEDTRRRENGHVGQSHAEGSMESQHNNL